MAVTCGFEALAAPAVQGLKPYQPGKPESELRRELGLERIVKLASNENPLGPSPAALEAVQACLSGLGRYPDGSGFELRRALAERLGVAPETITLGNGSNDVLDLVARSFLGPGRGAVFSRHAFAVYPISTQAAGGVCQVAEANPPGHTMAYGHDLAAMAARIDERTRVVFVANPNNPTGTWLTESELEPFIAALPDHSLVVVDEAYFEYAAGPGFPDAIAWLDRFPNLIVTRTFSKAYGLAGLRVGYAVSHPDVAEILNRVRHAFNVNTAAQVAAVAALADQDHVARSVALNRTGMERVRSALERLGCPCLPSAGNFLCADVGRPGREVFQALLRQGVIVRPVDNYGLPSYLRITIGTEEENTALISALESALLA